MPRGDGTGPMGMGPMTGRGAGFCAGYATPGYANFGGHCGVSGRGRGYRRMNYMAGIPMQNRFGYFGNYGTYEPTIDEKKILTDQVSFLENELQLTKQRLSSFDEKKEK